MNHHPLDHNVTLATESKGREEMAFPPRWRLALIRARRSGLTGGVAAPRCAATFAGLVYAGVTQVNVCVPEGAPRNGAVDFKSLNLY